MKSSENIKKAFEYFVFAISNGKIILGKTIELPELTGNYDITAKAFDYNLRSLISTVCIPSDMALNSAQQSSWQRIYTTERIRALKIDKADLIKSEEELTFFREKKALEEAQLRMEEYSKSEEGMQFIADYASDMLIRSLEYDNMKLASHELLRQGIVLLWSAIEVLARDLFIEYLNKNPKKISILINDPLTKSYFDLKSISIDFIINYDFDLSNCIGDLLVKLRDVSDLIIIKGIYKSLFSNNKCLIEKLNDINLWNLFQMRNLIVHKRGIVDEKYLKNSKSDLNVGDSLIIKPDLFIQYVKLVIEIGLELLNTIKNET